MQDRLQLQVHDLEVQVLTGIYSEETHLPQPLRIDLTVDLRCPDHSRPIRRCRRRKTISI